VLAPADDDGNVVDADVKLVQKGLYGWVFVDVEIGVRTVVPREELLEVERLARDARPDEDDVADDESDYVPTEGRPVILKLRKVIKKIRKSVQMRQKLRKCCEIYNMKYKVPTLSFVGLMQY